MRFLKTIVVFICLITASTGSVFGNTWYVKPDGSGDVPNIQAGIASATSGDTILLAHGVYGGAGNRDIICRVTPLTIISDGRNPDSCVIDCEGTDLVPRYGFAFDGTIAGDFRIQGITIERASKCGAISGGARTMIIVDCRFADNSDYGVGVSCDTLTILRSQFLRNSLVGLYGSEVTFVDSCLFVDQKQIGIIAPGYMSASNTEVVGSPWGIFQELSYGTYQNCDFVGNVRGLHLEYSIANIENSRFIQNGIGLAPEESWLTLSDCEFRDNWVRPEMFEVYAEKLPPRLQVQGYRTYGGGILIGSEEKSVGMRIRRCEFVGNSADCGGAIALVNEDSSIRADSCIFVNNHADMGSAIYLWGSDSAIDLDGCLFYDNHADDSGMIYSAGDPYGKSITLGNCTVYGNSSTLGSLFPCYQLTQLTISNSIFAFNQVEQLISCQDSSEADLSNCDAFGNGPDEWGGCISGQFGINGNISENPLFCNAEERDFSLREGSPCLAENNQIGGLIGAVGMGCEAITGRLEIAQPSLNSNSKGTLPAKLYGTDTLDPRRIDLFTVTLNGVSPLTIRLREQPQCIDLKFSKSEITKSLEDVPTNDRQMLSLSGFLTDGTPFAAIDSLSLITNGPEALAQAAVSESGLKTISPNPFNANTRITFHTRSGAHVMMTVYDVAGRVVERLVDDVKLPGEHTIEWNAARHPSGIYFCRLESAGDSQTRKLVLLK